MTITAKFAGHCVACGGTITAGDKIEWEKGKKARHAECPASGTVLNAAYQPKGETARTNRKAENCTFCGTPLPAGTGNLWWGEDGCCSNRRHFDEGGWHVTCFDRDACHARVQERRAKAETDRKARQEKADAERKAAQAAWDAARAEIPADYIMSMSVNIPREADTGSVEIGRHDGSVLRRGRIGEVTVYVQTWSGFDDFRTYLIAPPSIMRPLLDAQVQRMGLTREKAESWLAQYAGCVGEEIYRRALEVL